MSIDSIGVPGQPLGTPGMELTVWQAAVRDAIRALEAEAATATGWVDANLSNGWTNVGGNGAPARYRRLPGGLVALQGTIAGGTLGTPAFTLPTGHRPAYNLEFITACSGGVGARISVTSAGVVQVTSVMTGGSNTWVTLNLEFIASGS